MKPKNSSKNINSKSSSIAVDNNVKGRRNRDTTLDIYVLPFAFVNKCGNDIVKTIKDLYDNHKEVMDKSFLIQISLNGSKKLRRVEEEIISESEYHEIILIAVGCDEENVTRRWFKISKKATSALTTLKKSDTLSDIKKKFRNPIGVLLVADNCTLGNTTKEALKNILKKRTNNIQNIDKFESRISSLENKVDIFSEKMDEILNLMKYNIHNDGYHSEPQPSISPANSLSPLVNIKSKSKAKAMDDIHIDLSHTRSVSQSVSPDKKVTKVSKKQIDKSAKKTKKSDETKSEDPPEWKLIGITETPTTDGSTKIEIKVPMDGHCAALTNAIQINCYDRYAHLELNCTKLEKAAYRTALSIMAGFPSNVLSQEGDIQLRVLINETDEKGLRKLFEQLIDKGKYNENIFDAMVPLCQIAVKYNAKFYDRNYIFMEHQSSQIPYISGAPTIHLKLSMEHFAALCDKNLLISKCVCTMCGGRVTGDRIVCSVCGLIYDLKCILDDIQRTEKCIMKNELFELNCRQCMDYNSIVSLGPKNKKQKLNK